jgi:DNA polymerase III subunit gamma/tau
MNENIYNRLRPKNLSEFFPTTQSLEHVKTLLETGKIGRSIFLYGSSGCGKTTLARIVAKSLVCEGTGEKPCGVCSQCTNAEAWSIVEANAADKRGIDDMRSLIDEVSVPPLNSEKETVILDEAHQLSKDAQNALLKLVEECPEHLCMILCTTEPSKVIPTLRNRCLGIGFDRLAYSQSKSFISYVTKRLVNEGYIENAREVPDTTLETIIGKADGSARQLTVLTYVYHETGTVSVANEEQELLMKDLARVLLGGRGWGEMIPLVRKIKSEHEMVRIQMVNYFAVIALRESGEKLNRADMVLTMFLDPLQPTNQKADFVHRMMQTVRTCYAMKK